MEALTIRVYDKNTLDKSQKLIGDKHFCSKYEMYTKAAELGIAQLYNERVKGKSGNEIQERLNDIENLIIGNSKKFLSYEVQNSASNHEASAILHSMIYMLIDVSNKRKINPQEIEKGHYHNKIDYYKDIYLGFSEIDGFR